MTIVHTSAHVEVKAEYWDDIKLQLENKWVDSYRSVPFNHQWKASLPGLPLHIDPLQVSVAVREPYQVKYITRNKQFIAVNCNMLMCKVEGN